MHSSMRLKCRQYFFNTPDFCKEVAKIGLIYFRHNRNTKHRAQSLRTQFATYFFRTGYFIAAAKDFRN